MSCSRQARTIIFAETVIFVRTITAGHIIEKLLFVSSEKMWHDPAMSFKKILRLKTMLWIIIIIVLSVAALLAIGCFYFSAPGYQGPPSSHFDGKRFFNPSLGKESRSKDFFKWILSRESGHWEKWMDRKPGPPPPKKVDNGKLRVTFINHASVLIQMDGLNVLTDPVWSERISPVSCAGPKRRGPVGIKFEDLPPINAVLISHSHYDALDIDTLKRLANKSRPKIFAGLGNKSLFDEKDIKPAYDLDWWESRNIDKNVTVTFVPAVHFSGRGLGDRNKTLWGGFVIEGPSGVVYFAGDSGMGPHFQRIREKFGPPRVALLPIGAFRPRWFMSPMHISPEEAVDVHRMMNAGTSVGIHFGTFKLADDAQNEPPDIIRGKIKNTPDEDRFWILQQGEGRYIP